MVFLNKHLLGLKEYDGKDCPLEVSFTTELFWTQIHDLPFSLMNKKTGLSLGNTIRKCMKVDVNGQEGMNGNCLRLKVEIDITKPLRRGVLLQGMNKQELQWFAIKHERLQIFFYVCGVLGHRRDDCDKEVPEEEEELPYGEWMRASSSFTMPYKGVRQTHAVIERGGGGV